MSVIASGVQNAQASSEASIQSAASSSLLLTNAPVDESFDATIEVHRWTDADIPNFVSYSTLLLEVPFDAAVLAPYRQDLRQAELAGVTIVWIAGENASADVLLEISNAEPLRFRTPAPTTRCEIADQRFTEIFKADGRVYWSFARSRSLLPVAYMGNEKLTTALIGERANGATTIVLPHPANPALYSAYERTASGLTAASSPARQHARAFLRSLWGPVLIVLMAVGLRYQQRTFNAAHIHYRGTSSGAITSQPADKLVTFLESYSSDDLRKLPRLADGKLLDPEHDLSALTFFERLGFYTKGKAYLDTMLASRERSDDAFADAVTAYADVVAETIAPSLGSKQFERARFQAQKYLNAMAYLPPSAAVARANDRLDQARKVAELVQHNFLYNDSEAVAVSLDGVGEYNYYSGLIFEESARDRSLEDNAEYHRIKSTAGERTRQENAAAWSAFAERFPRSELADDAALNAISELMDDHQDVSGSELLQANRATIEQCEEFLARYPKSALADDVLAYEIRMAATIDDRPRLWNAFVRLSKMPASDAWRRFLYRLRCLWDVRRGPTSDGETLAAFVADAAQQIDSARDMSIYTNESIIIARLLFTAPAKLPARRDEVCAQLLAVLLRRMHDPENA